MGNKRTGYDYIPAPGEPYYPQGRPEEAPKGRVVASGTDSGLVEDSNGNTVLTDKRGDRRSK
jgi:hypothetical protein